MLVLAVGVAASHDAVIVVEEGRGAEVNPEEEPAIGVFVSTTGIDGLGFATDVAEREK